jgi:hypothetical protein
MLYEDGKIARDDTSLIIRRYYPWGAKKIPYSTIRSVGHLSPLRVSKWRLWGSGDFVHWWNLDRSRPTKELALVIDTATTSVLRSRRRARRRSSAS